MSRFGDFSKFRNTVFSAHKPEDRYTFPRAFGSNATTSEAFQNIDSNGHFVAIKTSNSSLGLADFSKPGKPVNVHELGLGLNATCWQFSPFFSDEPGALAVAGDNGQVGVVKIEMDDAGSVAGSSVNLLPSGSGGHSKKLEALTWNPVVQGFLASAGGPDVTLWDVNNNTAYAKFDSLKDTIWSLDFNTDGTHLALTSKDSLLHLFDVRTTKETSSIKVSTGPKPWKSTFLSGLSPYHILTTAFSPSRSRELKLFDSRNLSTSISSKIIDSEPSILMPVYDPDTNVLITASRGSPVLRWYEVKTTGVMDGATQYSGRDIIGGLCAIPKPFLDVMGCEVVRLLAINGDASAVVPISGKVPRKSYVDFQAELFPDTRAGKAAVNLQEFKEGVERPAAMMCLDPGKRRVDEKKTVSVASVADSQPAKPFEIIMGETSEGQLSISNPCSTPNLAEPEQPSSQQPSQPLLPPSTAAQPTQTPPNRVSPSTFRFLNSTPHLKWDNLKSLSIVIPNESCAIASNDFLIAIPLAGPGGRIGIIYTETQGKPNAPSRLPAQIPCLLNGSDVHEFAVDPFDSARIAAGCDDGRLRIWNVVKGMEGDRGVDTVDKSFVAGSGRVNALVFHPRAKDVMLTCSTDGKVKVWDLENEKAMVEILVPGSCLAAAFSIDGTKIAVLGRDKKVRIFDARSGDKLREWDSHDGVKGGRVVWVNEERVVTVGFGKASRREIKVYDLATREAKATEVDVNPGIISVFYDEDLNLLYLAGRGDRNFSVWTINDDLSATFLTRFESASVQQGFSFFPKSALDVAKVEVARCWRLVGNGIEEVSFTLPRTRTEYFQDAVYPDTKDLGKPAVDSAKAWFEGDNGTVSRISLKPENMASLSEQSSTVSVNTSSKEQPVSQRSLIGKDAEKAFVNTLLKAARAHEDIEEGKWEDEKEGVDESEWD